MHYCWAHRRLLKRARSPSFQTALSSPTWIRTATGRAAPLCITGSKARIFLKCGRPAKKGIVSGHWHIPSSQLGGCWEESGWNPYGTKGPNLNFWLLLGSREDRQRGCGDAKTASCKLGIPECRLILQDQGCRDCREGCKERREMSTSVFPRAAQQRLNKKKMHRGKGHFCKTGHWWRKAARPPGMLSLPKDEMGLQW